MNKQNILVKLAHFYHHLSCVATLH